MSESILFSVTTDGIATVTLNQPEVHNAFDDALVQQFLHILQQIQQDQNIKVVIIRAAGKSFSSGANLNWMRRMVNYSYEENIKDASALSDLMYTLKFLNKPTIARVQGAAFGGGVGLVACCDIAIATTEASFCFSEVKLGLVPAIISPYVMSVIGERAARRYFLTAELISATEAHRLGLATEVVAPEQLDVTIEGIIKLLLMNSTEAVTKAKELINRLSNDPYNKDHLQKNIETIAALRVSKEAQERLTKFLA